MEHREQLEAHRPAEKTAPLEAILTRDEVQMLELLELNTFEHLQAAFEDILSQSQLFEGDTSFKQAAIALDTAAGLFPYIDKDGDHMMTLSELETYLKQDTSANVEALKWLTVHFEAFSNACFFRGSVTRDDIEEARNVFHGLHHLHQCFGFDGRPETQALAALSDNEIEQYLHDRGTSIDRHDAIGLRGLVEYIRKTRAK